MTARNEHETPIIIIWALWQQFLPRKLEREIPIEIDARNPSGVKPSGWLNLKPNCVIQLPCRTLWPYFQYSRTFHGLFPVRYKLTPQALKFMHSHLVHLSHLFKCFPSQERTSGPRTKSKVTHSVTKLTVSIYSNTLKLFVLYTLRLENNLNFCLPGI